MDKRLAPNKGLSRLMGWSPVYAALLVTACSLLSGYSGDGRLADHGVLAAERYVLDLGPVDLTRSGRYNYRLAGLPNERMTIGFEIVEAEAFDSRQRPHVASKVRLLLETNERQTVVHEEGSLDGWRRSPADASPKFFYYRWGETRHVSIGVGVTRPENVGERLDHGWGTTFVPHDGRSYVLSLEVVEGDKALSSARLLLTSQPRVFFP